MPPVPSTYRLIYGVTSGTPDFADAACETIYMQQFLDGLRTNVIPFVEGVCSDNFQNPYTDILNLEDLVGADLTYYAGPNENNNVCKYIFSSISMVEFL